MPALRRTVGVQRGCVGRAGMDGEIGGMMLFRDEETGMYVPLDVLAKHLRPLLQPAPADTAGFAQWVANGMAQHTDARLLAADKRREVAERQLAEAQQAAEHWATQYRAAATERDTYRAQADAQRQAATEAAQRADAAEARLAAFYSPRPVYQD